MKIKNENPPILDKLRDAGIDPDISRVIFTYGDTIYNPGNIQIPDYLIEHEKVHSIQQGDDPEKWWERYIYDPTFRINQEAEAYGKQCNFIFKKVKDRNKRNAILMDTARILSSPTYGSVIEQMDAFVLIKEYERHSRVDTHRTN